ncbi:MAG: hypothetical protein K2M06_09400 [Muribaculaceae bacterium]|nr:hypothetical protein [Muribaculaceae bacterium]
MADTVQANKGAVSSLADTDLVMCVASGGSYRPVSYADLAKAIRASIHIGGRNLLKGTAEGLALDGNGPVNKKYPFAESMDFGKWAGRSITVSYDYAYENASTGSIYSQSRFVISTAFDLASGKTYKEAVVNLPFNSSGISGGGHKTHTFVVPEGASNTEVQQSCSIQLASGKARMWNIKIEEGNMPTAWTPAPEDLASGACGGG